MSVIYQITLKGHLAPIYAEWFAGFSIKLQSDGTTMLEGQVADQAVLYGTLSRVRDLGIRLLSVNEIGSFSLEELSGEAVEEQRNQRNEQED